MFARLCTTIRWLGTAMFVAVLIVWGVAAVRPMQTTLDLSILHNSTIHAADIIVGRWHFALASFRSVGPDYSHFEDTALRNISVRSRMAGDDSKAFQVVEVHNPLDVYFLQARTYTGATAPARFASAWIFSGHWWHLLALTLPFAARTTQLFIRRRRTRANPTACKSCGYDLRAGHDKCPECGGESHVPAKAVVE